MKKAIVLSGLLLASATVLAGGGTKWSYAGKSGAKNWAKLTPEFGACAGKNQSPVNLTGFTSASLKPIKFTYKPGGNTILNNGHTVQVNYAKGSSIKVDGITFNLVQFHFHAPSENHINGKSYPLEAHFVHADKKGNLAVVAVMFKQGKVNKELAKAWKHIPHEGEKHALVKNVSASKLLPRSKGYYRFNGSLTTPPCTEGVRWLVMKKPVSASKAQIAAFKKVLHEPNNRPIQPLNARAVLK